MSVENRPPVLEVCHRDFLREEAQRHLAGLLPDQVLTLGVSEDGAQVRVIWVPERMDPDVLAACAYTESSFLAEVMNDNTSFYYLHMIASLSRCLRLCTGEKGLHDPGVRDTLRMLVDCLIDPNGYVRGTASRVALLLAPDLRKRETVAWDVRLDAFFRDQEERSCWTRVAVVRLYFLQANLGDQMITVISAQELHRVLWHGGIARRDVLEVPEPIQDMSVAYAHNSFILTVGREDGKWAYTSASIDEARQGLRLRPGSAVPCSQIPELPPKSGLVRLGSTHALFVSRQNPYGSLQAVPQAQLPDSWKSLMIRRNT